MRAFFAPSSVEQPAEASVSLEAVNRWLNSRGELRSSPAFERLRAAVVVLTTKPKPRKEDVDPLCASKELASEGAQEEAATSDFDHRVATGCVR